MCAVAGSGRSVDAVRMLRCARVVLVLVVGLSAACSSDDSKSTTAPSASRTPVIAATSGYLFTAPDTVAYLQWQTTVPGAISGTGLESYVVGTAPNASVVTKDYPLGGRTNGDAIVFEVEDQHLRAGRIAAGTLTVEFAQADGGTRPVTFRSASPAEYADALSRLRASVEASNHG